MPCPTSPTAWPSQNRPPPPEGRPGKAPPPPLAVAGVVGELDGVHGPGLDAEALQREHRRGVADVAVRDVGLDGQNRGHGPTRWHTALLRPRPGHGRERLGHEILDLRALYTEAGEHA